MPSLTALLALSTRSQDEKKLLGIGSLFTALVLVEAFAGWYWLDYAASVVTAHVAFHSVAFLCAIQAIHFVNKNKDPAYTYGPIFAYPVATFVNVILLLIIIIMLTVHVLHRQIRFSNPSSTLICVARIIIDVFGLTVFWDETKSVIKRTIHPGTEVRSKEELVSSCVIHLTSNALVSFAFMLPNLVAQELQFVEPLAILICDVCVVYMVMPILQSTLSTLLLEVPHAQRPALGKCLRTVSFMDGVIDVAGWHFWQLPDAAGLQGQITLKIEQSYTDCNAFRRRVREYLQPMVKEADLTVSIYRNTDSFSWLLAENPVEV